MIKNYKKTIIGEEFWCSGIYLYVNNLLYRKYMEHYIPKTVSNIRFRHDYVWFSVLEVEKDLVLSQLFAYKREQKLKNIIKKTI